MKKLLYLFVASIIILSCTKNEKNNNVIQTANVAKVQDFYDQVMNAHNLSLIDSFCTADFIDHQADPHYPAGINGVKAAFGDYFTAFPDMHIKTNFIKGWGDTVITHFSMTGTNSGSFMGMPATNKQIKVDGVDLLLIKDGKAIEHWGYQEDMKMMAQLGMGQGPPADNTANKK